MNPAARRPFWLALVASLCLHVVVLTSPGWELPLFAEDNDPLELAATLTTPPAEAVPAPAPRPPPPRKPPPTPSASPLAAPAAPAEPVRSEEPPPPVETPPEAPVEAAPESPATVAPAPTFAHADILPKTGRIAFQVVRGDGFVVGQAEHRWRHDGTQYELRAVTETTGLAAMFKPASVAQESRGSFGAVGLMPAEYKLSRDGKLKESARFDAAQRRVFLGNGSDAAYRGGAQDMLSLFYQLGAFSFDAGPLVISVVSGRKLSYFRVSIGEAAPLDSPLGARAARHLKITGTVREDATEVWLDAQTRLPLKIRHRDRKGDVFDQIATAIELEPTP